MLATHSYLCPTNVPNQRPCLLGSRSINSKTRTNLKLWIQTWTFHNALRQTYRRNLLASRPALSRKPCPRLKWHSTTHLLPPVTQAIQLDAIEVLANLLRLRTPAALHQSAMDIRLKDTALRTHLSSPILHLLQHLPLEEEGRPVWSLDLRELFTSKRIAMRLGSVERSRKNSRKFLWRQRATWSGRTGN